MAYCAECGEWFEQQRRYHKKCWPCWRADADAATTNDAREQGYRQGYENGRLSGMREGFESGRRAGLMDAKPAIDLDWRDIRWLLTLAHPDKNPQDQDTAHRVTVTLIDAMKRAKAAR